MRELYQAEMTCVSRVNKDTPPTLSRLDRIYTNIQASDLLDRHLNVFRLGAAPTTFQ